MSSAKNCLYNENADDDYTSEDLLMAPCFTINSNVEYKEVPTTGEEYLLKVRKERKKYSLITKSNRDYSEYAKNQSCFVKEVPTVLTPDNLKPTIEWQNIQVADFSEMRIYISKMKLKKPKDLKQIVIDPNTSKVWWKFFQSNTPTLSCMIGIHHTLLDFGLEVLIKSLNNIKQGDSIDENLGQWIYAFLACINQPLLSETISLLRSLSRKCAEIRSHLNDQEEDFNSKVAPLNVFICIVARYFRQFDLAD